MVVKKSLVFLTLVSEAVVLAASDNSLVQNVNSGRVVHGCLAFCADNCHSVNQVWRFHLHSETIGSTLHTGIKKTQSALDSQIRWWSK